MFLVKKKKLAFTKINKKYVNKKNYLDREQFKKTVFSDLITMPRNLLRLWYFVLRLKFFDLHNVALAYKLVYF